MGSRAKMTKITQAREKERETLKYTRDAGVCRVLPATSQVLPSAPLSILHAAMSCSPIAPCLRSAPSIFPSAFFGRCHHNALFSDAWTRPRGPLSRKSSTIRVFMGCRQKLLRTKGGHDASARALVMNQHGEEHRASSERERRQVRGLTNWS